jgi:AraC-like DNA-binding protein
VHHEPELFFQVQGATDFSTPVERFRLMPGQLCLMPPLVGHIEQSLAWAGKPFANVVLMLHQDWLHLHFGVAGLNRTPTAANVRRYGGERLVVIRQYLIDVVSASLAATAGAAARHRGAMLAALGHVRDSLGKRLPAVVSEHPKVTHCRHIAATHLSDPTLNVREIARRVGCSPDYLSNLFHRETGIRLTAWLNEQRLNRAKDLLRDSSLNISEIAWATGYGDPGYLARRFRAATGRSPREYRLGVGGPSAELLPL